MVNTPPNTHPEAFVQADPAEATRRLVSIIRELRPLVLVTEPPGGLYPHPDHAMCHVISEAAFLAAADARAYPEVGPPGQVAKLYGAALIDDGTWALLRFWFEAAGFDMQEQLWLRAHRAGPESATVALDIRPYSAIQRQALLAHRTQVPPDSLWARLPDDLYCRAYGTAYFIRLYPPTAPNERETDLLDGLMVSHPAIAKLCDPPLDSGQGPKPRRGARSTVLCSPPCSLVWGGQPNPARWLHRIATDSQAM